VAGVQRFFRLGDSGRPVKPDVVSIITGHTHADFAIRAFRAGAHVFWKKPTPRRSRMPKASSPRPRRMACQLLSASARAIVPLVRLIGDRAEPRQAAGDADEPYNAPSSGLDLHRI